MQLSKHVCKQITVHLYKLSIALSLYRVQYGMTFNVWLIVIITLHLIAQLPSAHCKNQCML